jgi:hypothetical protein
MTFSRVSNSIAVIALMRYRRGAQNYELIDSFLVGVYLMRLGTVILPNTKFDFLQI